ncbi:MAG: LamG-like jellyroll fold domain-containing protein [Bacteroidia bacterium]
MLKIYKTLLVLLVIFANKLEAQVDVTSSLGTSSASYSTLKTAVDSINRGYHQGVINIRVHSNTLETATIILDSTGNPTGSNYSSILIRPADTATVVKSISTSGAFTLIILNGADNVIFDGRPGGIGTSQLLEISHTASAATNFTCRLNNGAANNTFIFCRWLNASAASTAHNIHLTNTTVGTSPNSNNQFLNNTIIGGRNGIVFDAINASGPMVNMIIRNNQFSNIGFACISNLNNLGSVTIDSNSFFHDVTFTATGQARAIALGGLPATVNVIANITKNRIFGLKSASTSIFGMIITPPASTSGSLYNIINNSIAFMDANNTVNGGAIGGVNGIAITGTGSGEFNIYHNTIRIGGAAVGGTVATLTTRSVGVGKFNSGTANIFRMRNNIITNTRTGGASTQNGHMAVWINTNTAGGHDIDRNTYQGTTFVAGWGGTVYATVAGGYQTATAPNEANTNQKTPTYSNNTEPYFTGTSLGDLDLSSTRIAAVATDIDNNSRPTLCYKGAWESSAPFTNRIDAAVQEVYSLGKIPVPYANPHEVRANIKNMGIDTIFSQKVRLSITGANTFVDSVYIDTLAPGVNKYVTFSPFNYLNIGSSLVTVSVPPDSTNTNNSKTFNQIATTGTYAYADPTLPAIGGVGFNGVGGDFIAKFPYTGSNNINQVGVNFNTGGQPFQIVIYSMINDTPNALIWNSPTIVAVTGINTISVNPPLPISGSFFVGVRQTGTTNVGFGYQNEDPIRNKTFYYKATTVTNWNDFASTNSAFRFMVEPRLQVADDIGIAKVNEPCAAVLQGGAPINPEFTVTNYGVNTQSGFTVKAQITGPSTLNTNDVVSAFIGSGSSFTFSSSSLFNPTVNGTYTVKVWTELATDLERNNDTIIYTFVVGQTSTANNSLNGLTFNGAQHLEVDGSRALNVTGEKLTIETWVSIANLSNPSYLVSKNATASQGQYDLYINTSGNIIFKVVSSLFADSIVSSAVVPISEFVHIAGTYDGILLRLFLNGNLIGTKSLVGTILGNTEPLLIGSSFNGGSYINGSLDEFRIWDTCRTEDQIRQNIHTRLANSSHPNLIAYYRFDELVGNYLLDASGNCNSATRINAAILAPSNFPLGTPIVKTSNVSSSGPVTFLGSQLSMELFNQVGSNNIYVHTFLDSALVTSPITSPGGITSTLGKYWIINRYGSGTMDSAEIKFNLQGILPSATNTDFKLFTRATGSSTAWNLSNNEANGLNFANQTVTMGVVPSLFNNQFIVGAVNSPLPVKLISFNGTPKNVDAFLLWSTANETNNKGFEIERSLDGKNFIRIDFVKGAINSNITQKYSYTDREVFATNKIVYYRLKQIDLDGKFEYTKTISISSDKIRNANIVVYPNPITEVLNIEMESFANVSAKLIITDLAGKKVKESLFIVNEGINKFTIDNLAELASGAYIINISSEGNLLFSNKFIKTK